MLEAAGAAAGDHRRRRSPAWSSSASRAVARPLAGRRQSRRAAAPGACACAGPSRGRPAARATTSTGACAAMRLRQRRPPASRRGRRRSARAARRRPRSAPRHGRPRRATARPAASICSRTIDADRHRGRLATARASRCQLAPRRSPRLLTSTSRTPPATNTSASATFWQHTPTAPAATCRRAISTHLWALPCARSARPAAATAPCTARQVGLERLPASSSRAGVSTRAMTSPMRAPVQGHDGHGRDLAAGGFIHCCTTSAPLGRDEAEHVLGLERGIALEARRTRNEWCRPKASRTSMASGRPPRRPMQDAARSRRPCSWAAH